MTKTILYYIPKIMKEIEHIWFLPKMSSTIQDLKNFSKKVNNTLFIFICLNISAFIFIHFL